MCRNETAARTKEVSCGKTGEDCRKAEDGPKAQLHLQEYRIRELEEAYRDDARRTMGYLK